MKKLFLAVTLILSCLMLAACGGEQAKQNGEKVFRYGTVAYGTFNENVGTNPHEAYCGWSTIRYGVGETLFKFDDKMELVPWLAESYNRIDDNTIEIIINDKATFSNGKKVTGEAVKACLDDLLVKHDRAPQDLKITSIKADGQKVTITSSEKATSLLNYLADPYGAIIDVEAGEHDLICVGTGPYIATKVDENGMELVKNENYWGEVKPKLDRIIIKSISDGDTLTMAMQNGELEAVQGLPYASLELFSNNDKFKLSSTNTSRVYQMAMNYHNKDLQDIRVRKAISMAIDKAGFTKVLLHGNGTPAVGVFPANMAFGGDKVKAVEFNLEEAKKLLAEAGYADTNGDGYVEKDGKTLELRYLTYTSRQELPLLAESAQDTLKQIGIKLNVNATNNYKNFLKNEDYDIYSKAFVTAPTGDPEYYFTTHLLDSSSYNHGFYHSDAVEALAEQLRNTFDSQQRADLAVKIQQQVLDDCAFVFASHLKMSFVMKQNVVGFEAHPSDYYEITPELDIQ